MNLTRYTRHTLPRFRFCKLDGGSLSSMPSLGSIRIWIIRFRRSGATRGHPAARPGQTWWSKKRFNNITFGQICNFERKSFVVVDVAAMMIGQIGWNRSVWIFQSPKEAATCPQETLAVPVVIMCYATSDLTVDILTSPMMLYSVLRYTIGCSRGLLRTL